ncbi:MBL fold metallo-hydrolase [Maribacter chungangensis]|uniref:MBL fold metallo-hydrolase n=1 Tax=Maribacter chungangensis TaxID=1069117 RepID=A0ABW3B8M4_9FLAO
MGNPKNIGCVLVYFLSLLLSFGQKPSKKLPLKNSVSLVILGTVQDAGSPHIACEKECCATLFATGDTSRKVVSLGVVDALARESFLFEATSDIAAQLRNLRTYSGFQKTDIPNGIFLTHAHIGHYTGLMYLGKEATNTKEAPVYAMPKMAAFLKTNGPWSQLVSNKNIDLKTLHNNKEKQLTKDLKVIPFTVPHRDEYSETVGYRIIGPNKSALFIPDIDKWEKWETSVVSEIKKVDYAFLDATFYDAAEINNRDISEIPHPFIIESMALFKNLPSAEKKKIHFIHFNHTNPLLRADSKASKKVLEMGFGIAKKGQVFEL